MRRQLRRRRFVVHDHIVFNPVATGTRTATLTVTDNNFGSTQTVNLTGTFTFTVKVTDGNGQAANQAFSLTRSPAAKGSATVSADLLRRLHGYPGQRQERQPPQRHRPVASLRKTAMGIFTQPPTGTSTQSPILSGPFV